MRRAYSNQCQTAVTSRVLPVTCLVGEAEDHAAVGDAADVPHRGDAAVVGVVLRPQVLQLQNLRLSLQLRPNQHRYDNVCETLT